MERDLLEAHATDFRQAIERTDRARLPVSFRNFPDGSCGDVTLLLGHYLSEQGATGLRYILGTRSEGDAHHTHAWIQGEGLIIDITADQFEGQTPCIVAERTVFHDSFSCEDLHAADYRVYDEHTVYTLGQAHREICANLARR